MKKAALVVGAAVNDCQSAPSNGTPLKKKHSSASSRLTRLAALAVVGFAWMLFWAPDAAYATAKSSTGTGNWNTAGTWSPVGVPANGDDVTVVTGHTVTVDVNTASLASLTVNGTLTVGNNGKNSI
jgi:G8 domain